MTSPIEQLQLILAALMRLGEGDTEVGDAERIDRIALLEQVKAAAAGAQAAEVVQFGLSQVEAQQRADVHPRLIGRGIADQVALACQLSPTGGSQRLTLARALWFDLPATFAALRRGQISEWVATLVSRETAHLDAATRRTIDADLALRDLATMSPRRAAAAARSLAYLADPVAAVARARIEEKARRVTVRPAPDSMAILTAYLPAAQGIAAWAALSREADSCLAAGDPRTRGQVMADALVTRVTGQAGASDLNVEIGLLLPIETLTGDTDDRPAELRDYGPIPAPLARRLLHDTRGSLFLRRLFTAPGGQIIGADDRRRRFPGALARLIAHRDQRCRDPFCDAPIRHLDHITRHTDGGPTNYSNGRGVCARGNYTREMPGWHLKLLDDGLRGQPHAVAVTTPTGHVYTSQAPQPP